MREKTNMFDDLLNGPGSTSGSTRLPSDELALYLSSGIEYLQTDGVRKAGDPIKWWWDHRDTYPRLSAMTSDYLSMPCTCSIVSRQPFAYYLMYF